jgi:hypothetical protein
MRDTLNVMLTKRYFEGIACLENISIINHQVEIHKGYALFESKDIWTQ